MEKIRTAIQHTRFSGDTEQTIYSSGEDHIKLESKYGYSEAKFEATDNGFTVTHTRDYFSNTANKQMHEVSTMYVNKPVGEMAFSVNQMSKVVDYGTSWLVFSDDNKVPPCDTIIRPSLMKITLTLLECKLGFSLTASEKRFLRRTYSNFGTVLDNVFFTNWGKYAYLKPLILLAQMWSSTKE